MLRTLEEACKKQCNGEPLGQIDLDGSFTALLKRGLIDARTRKFGSRKLITWYVTKDGIRTLKRMGSGVSC